MKVHCFTKLVGIAFKDKFSTKSWAVVYLGKSLLRYYIRYKRGCEK